MISIAFGNLEYKNVRAPYLFLAQPEKQLGSFSISWMKKAIIKRKKKLDSAVNDLKVKH